MAFTRISNGQQVLCVRLMLVFAALVFHSMVSAQSYYTISGYTRDASTGENLTGATVIVKELPAIGAISNAYGFYSMSIPEGKYRIVAQYIGYSSQEQLVTLDKNVKLNISLTSRAKDLGQVVVTAERRNSNITQTTMGTQKLDIKEINTIPVFFGESDLLKTIQLLPGIKPESEGSSGFSVRGGAADQNLILLDEATVYNASHLMGFFSVFNSDAIKDVAVYKGNEPAEYGGKLSSVVDIKMKDGNDKNFSINGGLGMISSRLTFEGPIVKDQGSFIISARRTYADLFLKLSNDTSINKSKLFFYDLNAKTNYKFSDKDRLYLSGYFGSDIINLRNTFGIDWGNSVGTIRWNHLYSSHLFSNTSLIFSNYDYKIHIDNGSEMDIISRIQDYGLKEDFELYSRSNNKLKFGFSSTYHRIIPGVITASINISLKSLTNKNAWENAAYISYQHEFSNKLSIEYGGRISQFSLLGPGIFYTYDENGDIRSTNDYSSGQFVKTYLHIEPRVTIAYLLSSQSSLKGSYARNTQNLHLISNSTSGNPTDLWIPSSNNVKPEIADQVSLGYFHNFNNNRYEFSTEIYYKNLFNQIDYKNGAELNFNDNVESQILFGRGRAYGLELFLKKKYGKFNGWISYTLSRSERKFAAINEGKYFPSKEDRRHDLSLVGTYLLNNHWTFSATWVYYTGNAVTFPVGKYAIDGETMFYYGQRNADRMPSYHRLDIGATWIRKKTARKESSWNFSLYNAYGHNNAYMINFRDSETSPEQTEAVQTTLFRFVPAITYNFKF